ncbi:MAG TPA: hypothetical protein VJ746_09870 [Nitrospira sp.]|nr:hypothetical protein [Nitrospira sp.]
MSAVDIRRARNKSCLVSCFLAFTLMSGCANTGTIPKDQAPNKVRIGLVVVRAAQTSPLILYKKPPKGFIDGLFRGGTHGAVLGSYVGMELAKFMVQNTPDMVSECHRQYRRGGCEIFLVEMPVMGLLALVTVPPLASFTAGLQEGFSVFLRPEIESLEKARSEIQERLKIQTTFQNYVYQSFTLCCQQHIAIPQHAELSETSSSLPSAPTITDNILETDVLQFGLVEVSSNALPEPDENGRLMGRAISAIFQQSRSSLYLLVQTKLLRANDGSLIDQRQLGYLSSPRSYLEWSQNNGAPFHDEMLAAYQALADQVVDKVMNSAGELAPMNAE